MENVNYIFGKTIDGSGVGVVHRLRCGEQED